MARSKEALTLSVPPGTKQQLDALAARLGFRWGDRPNASALIAALADGTLALSADAALGAAEVEALRAAAEALIDLGSTDHARVLMELLVVRGDLAAPLRMALLQKLGQTEDARRALLDEKIRARQPFYLYHRGARGAEHQLTVRFARIRFRERRSYLEIWSEEADGDGDLPGLAHNRFLRLDRAQGLSVVSSGGAWREGLDHVEATFMLRGAAAAGYDPDPDDVARVAEHGALVVTRRIASASWLLRELTPLGALCEVLTPGVLRERMAAELRAAAAVYGDVPTETPPAP